MKMERKSNAKTMEKTMEIDDDSLKFVIFNFLI